MYKVNVVKNKIKEVLVCLWRGILEIGDFLNQRLFCKVSKSDFRNNFHLEVARIAPEMTSAVYVVLIPIFDERMHYKLGHR